MGFGLLSPERQGTKPGRPSGAAKEKEPGENESLSGDRVGDPVGGAALEFDLHGDARSALTLRASLA